MTSKKVTAFPPGPKGKFLLGSLTDFATDPIRFLSHLQQSHGNYTHFKIVNDHTYLVCDPELIKEVFLTQHTKFIKNRRFWGHLKEIFGKGLLTNEGQPWKVQRKLAAPAFQRRSISQYMDCMVRFTSEMLETWKAEEHRSLHDEMMLVTANIAATTLFNRSTHEGGQRLLEAIHKLEEQITVRIRRPFFFIDKLPLKNNRIYKQSLDVLDSEIQDFITRYEKEPEANQTLLSMLMEAKYEDGSSMSRKQLRDEVISIFLAGHDTTAISLSWTAYLLSHHPEIKKKMLQEIDEVLQGQAPTYEDLPKLEYTKNVLRESMRLHPAAYLTGRDSTEDVKLGKYTIPKGATVFISPAVMHRIPEYFPEPDALKPERWESVNEKDLKYIYIPFGGGPRVCIGEHFSMMEAMTILTMMYQRYELEYAGCFPEGYLLSATMVPKQGMPVKLKQRREFYLSRKHESTPSVIEA